MSARLDSLNKGFRNRILDHDELTEQLRSWADAFPELACLAPIGTTPEGRAIWVLTIGPEPDRTRPGAWVDANMHASELCGSSVALAIAEDLLRLHLGGGVHDLPEHVADAIRETLVYVCPRISPDGAECVFKTRGYVRSVNRDRRPAKQHAHWVVSDVDGDGLCLVMRREDPAGEFVESKEVPGLLVNRELEDPPPYYRLYPEGTIANFDGHTIPDPYFLSDNEPDLNRNFPYSWAPEPKQAGAGAFPASEPESRAVVEFAEAHPHLFAWLNLHTFGGVVIRPLGDQPDAKMDPFDLGVFRQLEQWYEAFTSYPTVSGYDQFLYEPDKPLHGDLSDFAYHLRGTVGYVVELWDLFEQVGLPKRDRFVDRYGHLDREDLEALGRWDREKNQGRVLRPWVPVEHPQLGRVDVGGIDPLFGMWNPPLEQLPELCTSQSQVFLRLVAMAPRVRIRDLTVEPLGDGMRRVTATIANEGYLPTYIMGAARSLSHNEPLIAILEGAEVVGSARREIGHLEGWGRGRWAGGAALYFARSRGSTDRSTIEWLVRGGDTVSVRAGSCRVGWVSASV